MSTELREGVQRLRATYRALDMTCSRRSDGWRQEVVRLRREVANHMIQMSSLVSTETRSDLPALDALRSAMSALRGEVASLQASWPAVSLDPDAPSYRQSVQRVRARLEAVEMCLSRLEGRPAPPV